MKFIETNFNHKINNSSSWIVYICKTYEEAMSIHHMAMTQKLMHSDGDWYYTVSTNSAEHDCRVPKFFHGRGYYMTCIEHNNGDWNKEPTYKLFIVE